MDLRKIMIGGTAAVGAVLFSMSAQASLGSKAEGAGVTAPSGQAEELLARKGADDTKKDDRGKTRGKGRGQDDGRNHAGILKLEDVQLARRGADDAPGHIRKGRGRDDAPGDDHGGRGGRGADDHGGHGRHGGSKGRA